MNKFLNNLVAIAIISSLTWFSYNAFSQTAAITASVRATIGGAK